ncbi:MAG TPA: DivIVA domain-containing protein [Actinomycetota bacterium]|nr:DivIVA domain-containing protein [Actinomycetota bacterium]
MPLNPQDIVRKEFREALRGYNQADVDLFLDEVVEEYTRLAEDNQKMKIRIAALQQEVARLREGRGPATTPGPPTSGGDDPQRIENEVRARMRRFLEDQIKQLEASTPSATVQKIEREAPQAPTPEAPVAEQREPFWAGE